jgi:3',5'-cyclic AMP phosphodiesterase CpdA
MKQCNYRHRRAGLFSIAAGALLAAALGMFSVPGLAENPKVSLAFNSEGKLKILQITDIHWKDSGPNDMKSLALVRQFVDSEKPDVVIFTGDLVYGKKCPKPKEGLDLITGVPIERKIPWSFTPGNHDGNGPLTKAEYVAYLRSKPFCLMNGARICADGISHLIPVYRRDRGAPQAGIFLFDTTGTGKKSNYHMTADISRAQVDWYEKESGSLNAVAFFHKPTAEFFDDDNYRTISGSLRVVLPYEKTESDLIRAFIRKGTMRAVFCGHLHVNNLLLDAGGVILGFTRCAGYSAFGLPWEPRGGRVILLTGYGSGMETWEVTEK